MMTTAISNLGPSTFKTREAAEYLGLGICTFRRLVQQGQIPVITVTRDWMFNRETLDTWRRKMEHPL
jgi:excisionase family DNA binding protein